MELSVKIAKGHTFIDTFKSLDGTPFQLKIGFKGIDFIKMLSNSNYQEFEIEGGNIISINSFLKEIEIPLPAKENIKLTITPLPAAEFTTDIFIPYTIYFINDVKFKAYGPDIEVLRLEHSTFKLEFDRNSNKFTFKTKEFTSLVEAKNVFNFLNSLLNVTNELSFKIPNTTEFGNFSFFVEKENQTVLEELSYTTKLINDLVDVQNFYKVTFREFHFDLTKQEYDNLQILLLNMTGKKQNITSVKLNIDIYDMKSFEEALNSKNGTRISIVHKTITVPLFNELITIKNNEFITEASDAYFINKTTLKKQVKIDKTRTNFEIKVGSLSDSFVRYFSNKNS